MARAEKKSRKILRKSIRIAILSIILFIILVPLWWAITISFNNDALTSIPAENLNYAPAHNLVKYLNHVTGSDAEDEIPLNSILREFVGGSCFEK